MNDRSSIGDRLSECLQCRNCAAELAALNRYTADMARRKFSALVEAFGKLSSQPAGNIANCLRESIEQCEGLRGAGDVVASLGRKMGFRKKRGCGCNNRQKRLNDLIPFRK